MDWTDTLAELIRRTTSDLPADAEAALRRAGKSVEFIELPGEDHWLSRSETRQRMLTETLRFLQANNPAD